MPAAEVYPAVVDETTQDSQFNLVFIRRLTMRNFGVTCRLCGRSRIRERVEMEFDHAMYYLF